MCGIRRHKGRKTFILVKRITVKITKNIYYFFRYAYRFNLQIHTQVAPAREGGGIRPLVRKRPAAHGPRHPPEQDGPEGATARTAVRKRAKHPEKTDRTETDRRKSGGNGNRIRNFSLSLVAMAGLYFHIPFCKRVCAYCDFYKSVELDRMEPLAEAMRRELEARRDYLGGEPVRTRYFGGGTPSLCPPETIGGLLARAAELFDCSVVEETTLEANPDDLTPAYLEALRRTGIDRLSIGIQSFDDACLKLMNRRHTAAQAAESVRRAREAGFGNLTIDLIFGVPGFGGDTLRRSLDTALALGPEHISAYHLTIEPATAFGRRAARGDFAPVEEEVSEAEFGLVHDTLTAAGYEHYEVSNFARPGFRARHNAAYWHGAKYLGIGPAAHSFDGRERHWNVASVTQYIGGAEPGSEILSERDRFNEYLLTRLRTAEGIGLAETEALFGAERTARIVREVRPWTETGAAEIRGGRLAVPPRRMLLSDAVIETLFET